MKDGKNIKTRSITIYRTVAMKQYLDLVQRYGKRLSKGDRTGTGTKAYSDIKCV
jgi:hypothetical protein